MYFDSSGDHVYVDGEVADAAADGTPSDGQLNWADMSADGRYVAFISYDATTLTPSPTSDLYLKDLTSRPRRP